MDGMNYANFACPHCAIIKINAPKHTLFLFYFCHSHYCYILSGYFMAYIEVPFPIDNTFQ